MPGDYQWLHVNLVYSEAIFGLYDSDNVPITRLGMSVHVDVIAHSIGP